LLLRNKIKYISASRNRGFALPTILIASIVMLTVLLVSVTSTTAIRTAMFNQYYSQLAKVAGEAGIEYAQACLQSSANVPTWTNAKPLMPNTDCSGNVQAGYPAYVTTSGNVRSGFSLSAPTLDANGKAKTLPNSGFVEITRASNGAVWRRYNQPSVQATVVPDLCSGSATSTLGWNNAVIVSTAYTFPEPTAQQISIANGAISPGPVYFRKDFSITAAGSYTLDNQGDDRSEVYLDGKLVSTAVWPATDTTNQILQVGCHTLISKLTNNGILANTAGLKISLRKVYSSAPTVVSDSSWRVAAGGQKHFSDVNYYADPASWTQVRDLGFVTAAYSGAWAATWPVGGDYSTHYVSTNHSYDGSNNYPSGFTLFRDNRIITLSQSTDVRLTFACDDGCYPFLDGNLINAGLGGTVSSFTITMTEGSHRFGFLAYNVSGLAGYGFSAVKISTGELLTHTDSDWSAMSSWSATNMGYSTSYDNSFNPNPNPLPGANVSVLAVGGGGGSGAGVNSVVYSAGGGGGSVNYVSSYSVALGSYPIIVGAGGAGNGYANADNGKNSSFASVVALGGTGAILQGEGGDSGNLLFQGGVRNSLGAGGGAGSAASGQSGVSANVGGAGGSGTGNSITGSLVYYGGGGGGGGATTYGAGGAGGGGSNTAGVANTGGGGGSGAGSGGSGVVIVSYPTGTMTATGGTKTTSGGYTIHKFTTSGTFTVTSIP